MYFTPDEKALKKEAERLIDMYTPGTLNHNLGRIMLRSISQRQGMLKTIRHLIMMMQDDEDQKASIAYKMAVRILEKADEGQIMNGPGITSNQTG